MRTFGFRHADWRFPFLWETDDQPAARWHGEGDGPVHYLADTPDGAWAEFLRHEEIRTPEDLAGVSRRMWAVELTVDMAEAARPVLPLETLVGDVDSYAACQAEAARLRAEGATELLTTAAAMRPGRAGGQRSDAGLVEGDSVDGQVYVLFGERPELHAWACVDGGAPPQRLLEVVRPFGASDVAERRKRDDRRQLIDLTRAEKGLPERRSMTDRREGDRRAPGPDA